MARVARFLNRKGFFFNIGAFPVCYARSGLTTPTTGMWTTQADRLQFGTTTSVALDGLFDNVRLDVGSMPPAGAALCARIGLDTAAYNLL